MLCVVVKLFQLVCSEDRKKSFVEGPGRRVARCTAGLAETASGDCGSPVCVQGAAELSGLPEEKWWLKVYQVRCHTQRLVLEQYNRESSQVNTSTIIHSGATGLVHLLHP